jgi:hypothetical protein
MYQGQINGVILLDLKKAFDMIDHQILLSKLQAYEIRDHTFKWFQSYSDQRKQVCMLNNCKSDIETEFVVENLRVQILDLYYFSFILTICRSPKLPRNNTL